jgi:hypothetical protein
MAGFIPAIYVFLSAAKTWIAGTSPAMMSHTSNVRLEIALRQIPEQPVGPR